MPWITRSLRGTSVLGRLRDLARRRRGRVKVLLWGAVGLCAAGLVWIVATGVCARSELLAAQRDLRTLRDAVKASSGHDGPSAHGPGGSGLAEEAARSAAEHAERAHWFTTGPAWYVAARLPGLGGPFETVRGTSEVLDRLTGKALPAVVRTIGRLTAEAGGSHLDLSALREAAPGLERAGREVASARSATGRLPRRTWFHAVDRVRNRLLGDLDRMAPAMENAAVGARLLPGMLGADSPRSYLLVFQNPAEARGTGGMPGAYAVLAADKGVLAMREFGRDTDMAAVRPKVDLGEEFHSMYASADSVNTWPNTNMSPHFPYAARIWSAAWHAKSGKRVDGVLSLDPGVLSRLLTATGPAWTADGTRVTAENVVDLTERANYAMYTDPVKRKAFLLDVARAAAGRLLSAAQDPGRRRPLLLGLYEVVRDGRMTAWSAHAAEERELQKRPVGGSLPQEPAPYAGLVVNNAAGTKLDYYLDRTLDWSSGRCTAAGREVTVRAVFGNRAPSAGLPGYVTDRLDKPGYATRQGDNRLLVSYFATPGAVLAGVTVDGRPAFAVHGRERGHPVYTLDVEVPAGKSRVMAMRLLEPPSDTPPTVLRQRLTRPLRVTVRPGSGCPGGRP
ncbi:DUF4012 domain-containing protein [Streptomyces sp. NPDC003753]